MAWQLYVEDDKDKSPTQEELEILLRAAGVGAGVSTSRTGESPAEIHLLLFVKRCFGLGLLAVVRTTRLNFCCTPDGFTDFVRLRYFAEFSGLIPRSCFSCLPPPLPFPSLPTPPGGGGVPSIPGRELSERQARDVGALLSLPSLQPLASHLSAHPDEWCRVLDEDDGERFVPADDGWTADGVSRERRAFLALAVVHALRPDRTMAAAEELVETVFSGGEGGGEGEGGAEAQEQAETGLGLPWNEVLDLEASVREGPGPEAPVLLCSEAGHDASWKVTLLAPRSGFGWDGGRYGARSGAPQA